MTDPDRALALLYVPRAARAGLAALFALDDRMGALVRGAREPMLAAIKLAWWRERIEALGTGAVPGEPLLRTLAIEFADAEATVAAIVEGWEAVLAGEPIAGHAARGEALFAVAAWRLGAAGAEVREAGACWALVDAARWGEGAALAAARERAVVPRWPKPVRPIGMLALLAAQDAARGVLPPQGTPARAARMAWHRISGR